MRYTLVFYTILLLSLYLIGCVPAEQETDLSTEQKIDQINEWLPDLKMELAMENKYACCLKEGCNECILAHGSCPCYHNLQEGKPVCGECYVGWQSGKGIDNDFTKDDVKLGTDHSH
jgi:hypothetical protein